MPKDPQQAVIEAILNKGRQGVNRGKQQEKPYERPGTSSTTAESGAWKHDLYDGPKELVRPARSAAGRGGRARGGDLIDGPQSAAKSSSLADRMRGFGVDAERKLAVQQRKEVMELLPQGGSPATAGRKVAVRTAVRRVIVPVAAMTNDSRPPRRRQTERIPGLDDPMETQSSAPASTTARTLGVKGTADGPTKVIMEGLLKGTSDDDVKSAFSEHVTITSVSILPQSTTSNTVSAEVLIPNRTEAQQMIDKFNGVVADGTPLKLYFAPAPVMSLSERLVSGGGGSTSTSGRDAPPARRERPDRRANFLDDAMKKATASRGVDLLAVPGTGKMYSDEILKQDINARVITLAEEEQISQRSSPSLFDLTSGRNGGGRDGRGNSGRGGNGHDLLERIGGNGSGNSGRDSSGNSLLKRLGVHA